MRRNEKQMSDPAEIAVVIAEATVCRIAMCDAGRPYLVPMSFGYRSGAFYVHCAAAGRKLEILRKNPHVCIELEAGVSLKTGRKACDWGMNYRSVIGFGTVAFLEGAAAKREALDIIMGHYAAGEFVYTDEVLAKTAVLRVDITALTGKRSG